MSPIWAVYMMEQEYNDGEVKEDEEIDGKKSRVRRTKRRRKTKYEREEKWEH